MIVPNYVLGLLMLVVALLGFVVYVWRVDGWRVLLWVVGMTAGTIAYVAVAMYLITH